MTSRASEGLTLKPMSNGNYTAALDGVIADDPEFVSFNPNKFIDDTDNDDIKNTNHDIIKNLNSNNQIDIINSGIDNNVNPSVKIEGFKLDTGNDIAHGYGFIKQR
ncbi:unnamed protein product [[Candida] boidinii]|nr:unnamed protein product [[Candida] boidinii]